MFLPDKSIMLLSMITLTCIYNNGIAQKTASKQPVKKPINVAVKSAAGVYYDTTYKGWKIAEPGRMEDRSLIADRKGNIYAIVIPKSYKREEFMVSKLVNNKWVGIQGFYSEPVDRIWLTKDDSLVMSTRYTYNHYYLTSTGWAKTVYNQQSKAYDNRDSFSLKDFPPLPDILTDPRILPYPVGQLFVRGLHKDDPRTALIYGFTGNKWKQVAKFELQGPAVSFSSQEPIVVKNKIYTSALMRDAANELIYCLALFDNSPVIAAKKIYRNAAIPVIGLDADAANVLAITKAVGIFEENGKKGLRNNYGETVVYPVFESITLEPGNSIMPAKEKTNIAFHLVGNNMNIYSYANSYSSPELLEGFAASKIKCSVCSGTGKQKDEVVKEKVKGEWVPEQSSSSPSYKYDRVWNANTNVYDNVRTQVTTTTTKPGYYKDGGYKEKTIPGKPCTACTKGETGLTKSQYYFDNTTRKYLLRSVDTELNPKPAKKWADYMKEANKRRGY